MKEAKPGRATRRMREEREKEAGKKEKEREVIRQMSTGRPRAGGNGTASAVPTVPPPPPALLELCLHLRWSKSPKKKLGRWQ